MTRFKVKRKHSIVVITILILLLSTLFPHSAIASIKEAFTYQGKIVNTDGTNLTNTDASCVSTGGADTCDLRVSLYTAVSGGTLVWQETKSDIELYDNDGIINLVLDCGGTFSSCNQNGGPDFTSGDLFIEVDFDPDGDGDFAEGETFAPRREMTAVPYSFHSSTSDSADTLDDIDSASFLRSDTSDTFDTGMTLSMDGTLDVNGTLEVDGDITISDTGLVFDGASTEFTVSGNLSINTDDLFIKKTNGYIGINNADPQVELDVSGGIRSTQNLDVEGYASIGDGSALDPNSGLIVDYDSTYAGLGQQLLILGSVTGASATNVYGVRIEPESITIPSGTTTLAASLYLNEPAITETGTLTNSATMYIAGAATEADNNFALWIDSGAVQIDEDLTVNNDIVVGNDLFIGGTDQVTADIYLGADGTIIVNGQNNNSDFRIDGSGPSLEAVFFTDASEGTIGVDTSAPTAYLDLPAADTDYASARVRTGSEPSSPNEGDIYADGTDIYYRAGGGWVEMTAGITLQETYQGGNTIDITSAEGALTFDAVSANFDIEIGEGTNTGDFRIWDGTNNWFNLDEGTSAISLGNAVAATSLSLTSGTNWSVSTAGAVSGFTTLSTSGDWTWTATTPTITVNSGETFTVSDGTDSFTFNSTNSSFGMSDGSNSFTFDVDSGPSYAGTARPTKTITLSPEYPGAVLTDFYGGGTDTSTTGTMTSDAETVPASNIRSYYSWERGASGQHFYTVAVRVTLPEDFSAWSTSNAAVVNYITESATSTDSDVDVRIYLEGNGTVDASSIDNASVTWATTSFGSTDLDLWNAAGETAVIYLRLGSASGNFARVGDIELSYLASY